MGGRPGEVSPRWVSKQAQCPLSTVWRWCREGKLTARPEYSRLRNLDGPRRVVRYWLVKEEVAELLLLAANEDEER